MGQKKRNTWNFLWQSTTPIPFVPNLGGQSPTGSANGAMASTNTIYSNIQDISNTDNQGLQVDWTGTPTGTLTVMVSESGTTFHNLTFNPVLTQPTGSAGGYVVNLNQIPWRYIMLQYVNSSGSGTLTAWLGSKDLN